MALNNSEVSQIDTCAVAAYQASGGRLEGVCEFGVDPLATSRELTQQRLTAMELNIPSPEELFSRFRFCKICD